MKPFLLLNMLLVTGLFAALQARPAAGEESVRVESPLSLEIIHEIPTDIISFVRQENYFYATDQNNFYVIDAQDPTYPQMVSALPGGGGYEIAVAGNHAYVVTGLRTVSIVDISTPETPNFITSYNDFEPEFGVWPTIRDVAATDETLFVSLDYFRDRCPEGGKIAILDVSDPANPVRVGETGIYAGGGSEIEIVNDILYHLWYQGLRIFDVSTPGTMEYINYIGLWDGVHHRFGSIVLDEGLALLSYSDGGFPCPYPYGLEGWFVVDVSDPNNPNPPFLVYQENIFRTVAAQEDGYLFTLNFGELEILALPDFKDPILGEINSHKTTMYFSEGTLTFLPEYGMTQIHRLATARLCAASTTVSPTLTSTLTYTDTNGMTEVLLPAGAVDDPAEVSILPLPAPDNPPADRWVKQAFDIRGHFPGQQLTLYEFQQPLTATLPFTDDPVAYPLGWEFLHWSGTKWIDPAETCAPDLSPAAAPHVMGEPIQVSFCLPGKYGLFVPIYAVSLPVIHR